MEIKYYLDVWKQSWREAAFYKEWWKQRKSFNIFSLSSDNKWTLGHNFVIVATFEWTENLFDYNCFYYLGFSHCQCYSYSFIYGPTPLSISHLPSS